MIVDTKYDIGTTVYLLYNIGDAHKCEKCGSIRYRTTGKRVGSGTITNISIEVDKYLNTEIRYMVGTDGDDIFLLEEELFSTPEEAKDV